jgi:iron complex outermembrane receptor protein
LDIFSPYACAQIARQNARGDGPWDVENNDRNPLELIKQWSAINTTTWRASDTLTIKNIISYSEYRESASFNLWGDNYLMVPGSAFPVGGGLFFATPYAGTDPTQAALYSRTITLEPGFYPWTTSENSFTEELQFQGHTGDGRFTWQAGGYLEVAKPLGWNSQLVDDFIDCSDIGNFVCTKTLPFGSISDANTKDYFNDKALYAQATYKITDQLSVTGGIRYTWDKMTDLSESLNIFVPTSGVGLLECQNILKFHKPIPPGTDPKPTDGIFVNDASQCDITTKISSSRPTWLIESDYKPNQDMMFYIKWARGYRMGSITSNSVGFETVGPEKLDLYEIGAKTTFRGAVSGYFNIAGFYNDFHNQQITINPTLAPQWQGVLPNASPNINAGHSRIWGVEIDSSFNLFQGFKLDVGYTYLNTKVLAITVPTPPVYYVSLNPTANVGDPLALSPKNTVVVTGTYTLPLDESVGRISFGATFTHADANRAQAPSTSPVYLIKAENQLNLNADWRGIMGNPVDLSFYMTNVTNQARILFPGSAFQTIGIDGGHMNQPRMWGFRLKYRFGGD